MGDRDGRHTQGYETAIKWLLFFLHFFYFFFGRTSTSVKVGQKVAGNELLIK